MNRTLRRDPVLVITAALTLAVCIGANTTVFSLVNSILLRPLPYADPGRLYWVTERFGGGAMEVATGSDYYTLRKMRHLFAEAGAYGSYTVNWSGVDRPEQLEAAQVTPSFFATLGVRPMMGRYLAGGEEGRDAPRVAVLSYAFWRSRLASDPALVGKTITLDGAACDVIGVMPQGFDFPHGTQVWRPVPMDEASQLPRSAQRPMRIVSIVARLAPSVPAGAVDAQMDTATRAIRAEYPKDFEAEGFLKGMQITAVPLARRITGDLRPALWALTGAVGLVLLIACANLANLLLARSAARQRELAVRMALGSSRHRLVRDVLAESLLLALPGGLAGTLLAALSVWALNTWKPMVLDRYPAISMDLRTLAFTLGVTILTGLVFGVAPALGAAGVNIIESLKAAGAHTGALGAARLRRLLVVVELGVSLVLLIGAGLLARSFVNLARTPLGFPSENLLTFRVNLTGPRYATGDNQMRYHEDALAGLRSLPVVKAAAVATDLPLGGERPYLVIAFQVAGRLPLPPAQWPQSNQTLVSRDYFAALGVPLRAGRLFDSQDAPKSAAGIVVNEAFVRKVFPGEDPVGRTILIGRDGNRKTIVGVVGSVRGSALGEEPPPLIYNCLCQQSNNRFLSLMNVVVRTAGDPHTAIRAVESRMYAVDRSQPVFDVKTMDERVAAALAPQRFNLLLLGLFAAMAVVLASLGVYGVMAYLVTRRTREIGIRIAIGARPEQVQRQVLAETAWLAAAAVCAGVAGAWGLTRYLRSLLYGVTALDAATFAAAAALLVAIAIAASAAPARRASLVDPVAALREE
ncbi:MAG TPA: ABC transporter permease [Candidatus Acidoferrales bacterium]|nr:ABC transporter permease [Candidatus Acidoferrales bacterium]